MHVQQFRKNKERNVEFKSVKPSPPTPNSNAPGGRLIEARNGVYLTLATNRTPWNAVNLETGDLATLKDEELVAEV